jgi:hypothetical protein
MIDISNRKIRESLKEFNILIKKPLMINIDAKIKERVDEELNLERGKD